MLVMLLCEWCLCYCQGGAGMKLEPEEVEAAGGWGDDDEIIIDEGGWPMPWARLPHGLE